MSREWKPGEVARVEYGGFDDIAVRIDPRDWAVPAGTVRDANVTDVRPLVVIDPEDREAVERLWIALRDGLALRSRDNLISALREYANPTPPKPDEPQGLGAVVEDEQGLRWTRVESGEAETRNPWYPALDPSVQPAEYADIAAVRVLSPGVEVDQ